MEETVSKKKLRDACRYARAKLPPEEKKARDEAICSLIAQSPEFRRAKKVFLYVPMAGEIDLIPLAKRCRREGKTIAFPVTEVGSDRLTFRTLRQGDKLAAGLRNPGAARRRADLHGGSAHALHPPRAVLRQKRQPTGTGEGVLRPLSRVLCGDCNGRGLGRTAV